MLRLRRFSSFLFFSENRSSSRLRLLETAETRCRAFSLFPSSRDREKVARKMNNSGNRWSSMRSELDDGMRNGGYAWMPE
jgi:hypothetical protein